VNTLQVEMVKISIYQYRMDVLGYAGYLDGYWDLCVKYYLK